MGTLRAPRFLFPTKKSEVIFSDNSVFVLPFHPSVCLCIHPCLVWSRKKSQKILQNKVVRYNLRVTKMCSDSESCCFCRCYHCSEPELCTVMVINLPLLNKSNVNGVTLNRQNLYSKCCQILGKKLC